MAGLESGVGGGVEVDCEAAVEGLGLEWGV